LVYCKKRFFSKLSDVLFVMSAPPHIHSAAESGDVAFVRAALSAGVDVDIRDDRVCCCEFGCCQYLL